MKFRGVEGGGHFDVLPGDVKAAIENDELSADDTKRLLNLANPGSTAFADLEQYQERHGKKT